MAKLLRRMRNTLILCRRNVDEKDQTIPKEFKEWFIKFLNIL